MAKDSSNDKSNDDIDPLQVTNTSDTQMSDDPLQFIDPTIRANYGRGEGQQGDAPSGSDPANDADAD